MSATSYDIEQELQNYPKKLEYSFLNPNSGITNYKRQSNGQLVSNGRLRC